MKAMLPTVLDKGLSSNVRPVRNAALDLIMKITKSAGALLKPHLSVLIPALVRKSYMYHVIRGTGVITRGLIGLSDHTLSSITVR